MKYIKVVNFIEMSSNTLLKTLDYCYELDQMVDNENIFLNFKDKRIKCFFIDNLFKEMKHNYSYGVKLLVINTCYPSYNWRKETRGHTIKPNRYNLVDPSVKINIKVLEQFLNYCWDCISKKSDHLFLSHPNLDCLDLKQILTKEIGDEVITYVPNRFLLLSDPNYEYIRKSEDIIPEYLVRDIKNFLVETNL